MAHSTHHQSRTLHPRLIGRMLASALGVTSLLLAFSAHAEQGFRRLADPKPLKLAVLPYGGPHPFAAPQNARLAQHRMQATPHDKASESDPLVIFAHRADAKLLELAQAQRLAFPYRPMLLLEGKPGLFRAMRNLAEGDLLQGLLKLRIRVEPFAGDRDLPLLGSYFSDWQRPWSERGRSPAWSQLRKRVNAAFESNAPVIVFEGPTAVEHTDHHYPRPALPQEALAADVLDAQRARHLWLRAAKTLGLQGHDWEKAQSRAKEVDWSGGVPPTGGPSPKGGPALAVYDHPAWSPASTLPEHFWQERKELPPTVLVNGVDARPASEQQRVAQLVKSLSKRRSPTDPRLVLTLGSDPEGMDDSLRKTLEQRGTFIRFPAAKEVISDLEPMLLRGPHGYQNCVDLGYGVSSLLRTTALNAGLTAANELASRSLSMHTRKIVDLWMLIPRVRAAR